MNLEEYRKMRLIEYPTAVWVGRDPLLPDVVKLDEATLDLKRHLAGVILCRCFPFTGGINFDEPKWFITHFLATYQQDAVRPWLTKTIHRAIELISSENVFTDNLIGTTFMFGILEFYAGVKLSGRTIPIHSFDVIDNKKKQASLGTTLGKLQKKELPISLALNKIDEDMFKILKRWAMPKDEWKQYKVVERVSKARNDMLHGNQLNYFSMGEYMAMLYILFHLYDLEDKPVEPSQPI